jgi:drug/metabolite transporter (DMT)-like permease
LAVVSGAITSALGYVAWYRWLKHLSAAMAGVVQLLTPVVAAAGAGVLLGEALPGRLWVATGLILGGMALALPGSKR